MTTSTPTAPTRTLGECVVNELRASMARQRITQAVLASSIGRSQPWVSRRLSRGDLLTFDDVDLLAKGLGVPADTLVTSALGARLRVDEA